MRWRSTCLQSSIGTIDAAPTRWSRQADVVVTTGCGDTCRVLPGHRYEEWVLPDPGGQSLDTVRPIRDKIEHSVRTLLNELGVLGD